MCVNINYSSTVAFFLIVMLTEDKILERAWEDMKRTNVN